MRHVALLATLLCAGLAVGCGGGSSSEPPAPHVPKTYIAGFYQRPVGESYRDTACYWVDGVRHDLAETEPGQANTIAVSDSRIFLGGKVWDSAQSTWHPAVWTITVPGATPTRAILTGNDSQVFYLLASGTGYRASGSYSATDWFPCTWLNGTRTDLPGHNWVTASATGMSQKGSTLIYSGTYWNSYHTACYWKDNGTSLVSLPKTGQNSVGNTCQLADDGALYVCGHQITNGTNPPGGWAYNRACYWKVVNGTAESVLLPDDGDDSGLNDALDITLSGNDIYVAGFWGTGALDKPCYWLNGTKHDLPSPEGRAARAKSIRIVNGKTVIAGYYSNGTVNVPCMWVDGVISDLLSAGTTHNGGAAMQVLRY